MIRLELGAARIFVRPGATDLRKQINGLVLLVQEQMQLSPFEAALFCPRRNRVNMSTLTHSPRLAAPTTHQPTSFSR